MRTFAIFGARATQRGCPIASNLAQKKFQIAGWNGQGFGSHALVAFYPCEVLVYRARPFQVLVLYARRDGGKGLSKVTSGMQLIKTQKR